MIIIKNRKLLIPEDERYIGTTADSNSEVLTFRIDRFTQTEMDLSTFTVKADIYRYETEETDRADLEMEVQDKYILLYLYITSGMVAYPGAILIDIKAFNDDGTVKWSSYKGAFFVEDPFATPQATLENLTELEQLEARINRAIRKAYEKAAEAASAWLEENISEIEGYVLDKSLSVSGAAADAKAAGDAINKVREASDNSASVKYHHLEEKTDTSWILVKLPRDKYALAFHNCSGSDADSPTTRISNPRDYLSEHLTADIVTNCNYGGLDYPGRLNGTNYTGTVFTRRLFCFDTDNQDIYISAVGAAITSIASKYDVAFAVDEILVQNGAATTFTELERYEPRNVFGWDDDYFYILFGEGRGNQEKGLTLTRCQTIMLDAGAQNAVNFDGGGSVCLAANISGTSQKVNQYRDYAIEYPGLRKVGLCAVYTRKEA